MKNEIGKSYTVGEKACDYDTKEDAFAAIHVDDGYTLVEVDVDEDIAAVCIEDVFYEQHVSEDGESIEPGEAECTELVAKYVICEDYFDNDPDDISPSALYAHSSGEPHDLAKIYSGSELLEIADEIDWECDVITKVWD